MEKLRIVIGSPVDYEELVAYLWIEGRKVGLIHQEDGRDKLKVKLYASSDSSDLDLSLFTEASQLAKEALVGNTL